MEEEECNLINEIVLFDKYRLAFFFVGLCIVYLVDFVL